MTSKEILTIFEGTISLRLPEDFRQMTDQEIAQTGGRSCNNSWSARDAAHHMMLEIGWSKIPLFGKNIPLQTVVGNTERTFKQRCGNYGKLKEIQATICGQDAHGIRYTYIAQGIEMEAEYLLVRYQKKYYGFSLLARREGFDEQYPAFEKILATVTFH